MLSTEMSGLDDDLLGRWPSEAVTPVFTTIGQIARAVDRLHSEHWGIQVRGTYGTLVYDLFAIKPSSRPSFPPTYPVFEDARPVGCWDRVLEPKTIVSSIMKVPDAALMVHAGTFMNIFGCKGCFRTDSGQIYYIGKASVMH